MLAPPLKLIFEDNPLAFQSIYFHRGSQQSIHQDTAYVITKKPLSLAASWLSLQDVEPGSGELAYYPKSHKYDHFYFDRDTHRKSWQSKSLTARRNSDTKVARSHRG